jgi:integrase
MSDAVVAVLKDLKPTKTSELVFPNEAGNPRDMRNLVRRSFRTVLKKAEIPPIRFHDLRHTIASLLLANGESLKHIQEQMSHTSIRVTSDIYGHLIPGANRQAVNKLPAISGSARLKIVE